MAVELKSGLEVDGEPFVPNADTLEALAELDRREALAFSTLEELMAELDADD